MDYSDESEIGGLWIVFLAKRLSVSVNGVDQEREPHTPALATMFSEGPCPWKIPSQGV